MKFDIINILKYKILRNIFYYERTNLIQIICIKQLRQGVEMDFQCVSAEEDKAFLFEVYLRTRKAEVMSWGWSEKQELEFLRLQFQCRQHSYRQHYPMAESKIIVSKSLKMGYVLTARTERELVLVDIALLPDYQGQEIGTALIKSLQQEASCAALPLCLSVLNGSPAKRLYDRLGFQVIGGDEVYLRMEWNSERKNHWEG